MEAKRPVFGPAKNCAFHAINATSIKRVGLWVNSVNVCIVGDRQRIDVGKRSQPRKPQKPRKVRFFGPFLEGTKIGVFCVFLTKFFVVTLFNEQLCIHNER